MPTQFFIYCIPRTGSYHLSSLLDSAPDVVCHGELFKPERLELRGVYKSRIQVTTVQERDSAPLDYLGSIRDLEPDRNFGFKLFPQHANRVPAIRALFKDRDWKIIILARDPIETYASMMRARETMVWTKRKLKGLLANLAWRVRRIFKNEPPPKVHFTPESLDGFAHQYNRFVERCRGLRKQRDRVIVAHYSQLNDPGFQSFLLNFVGSAADPLSLKSKYEKQYEGTLADGFDNWSELQDHIAMTKPFLPLPPATYRG